ncbi:MAG: hypothetical protein JNJ57_05325, partial [Saprospiraceae bacterium]|nr:hypothetical protein [Saprospiraceae bacterium]
EEFKRQVMDTLFPKSPWLKWVGPIYKFIFQEPTPIDDLLQRFAEQARLRLRRFLTDKMMFLGFPGGANLPLGADLSAGFSANLRSLEDPELLNLLAGIDPTPDSLLDTGAIDWADLPDRLHFIADLFRCFHQHTDLLLAPFLDEQVAALKNETLPSGPL